MNVDMPKNLTYAFCTTDGGTTIAVEKSRYAAESFNAELETGYRSRIGLEAWGDNKVDNKVDNNAWGDIKVDNKVDNNVGDDTVTRPENGAEPDQKTVRSPTRTRPEVDNNLGDTVNGTASGPLSGLKSGPLSGLKSGLKSSLGATDSKVIDFIRSNPSVTIKELQELLNLSRNGVRKALGRLKSMGRLRRVGPDKGGHWEVVEK